MTENLNPRFKLSDNVRYIPMFMKILAVVAALSTFGSLFVFGSIRNAAIGVFDVSALSLPILLSLAEVLYAIVTIRLLRTSPQTGVILAVSIALVVLPTMLLPISLGIFGCLIPAETTDALIAQLFRQPVRDRTPPEP